MARDLVARDIDTDEFTGQAAAFMRERPEITHLTWVDAAAACAPANGPCCTPESLAPAPGPDRAAQAGQRHRARTTFRAARDTRTPAYSRAFADGAGGPVFQLHLPLAERNTFAGTLVVEYSVESLVRHFVPADVAQRHMIAVVDEKQAVLAATVTALPGQKVAPRAHRQRRPAHARAQRPAAARPGLAHQHRPGQQHLVLDGGGAVGADGVDAAGHLAPHAPAQPDPVGAGAGDQLPPRDGKLHAHRHARDGPGRPHHLRQRRLLPDDRLHRGELVGRLPPYPYWPPDRIEENGRLLQQELQGRSPTGGIEVKVMRKDGTRFDARMYISPLIDPKGQQTGWMTSMTNITEAKRIRDQLSASHERFTTVLEGLDASVSVLSVQQGELLFANRSYRLWFGGDARGHQHMAGAAAMPSTRRRGRGPPVGPAHAGADRDGASPREVYVESLQKWFDVRARYLQWTDGRLAQMLIATDITARLRAEEQTAAQAEKAQVTSRLVTMGEMASSVAHELNQPLTAITNYCNGMVSRVKADSIEGRPRRRAAEDGAPGRTRRADHPPHPRLREAQRAAAPAGAGAADRRRRGGTGRHRTAPPQRGHPHLRGAAPAQIMADPILIEQVVLNLLKNAAEAIDSAQLAAARRHIELRVVPRHTPDEGGVIEFSVTDMGPGLKEEVIGRLYEAFFSTKAEGLGIGLALCRTIVESHRGRMRAQNLYNGAGRRLPFCLHLPVELPAAPTRPRPRPSRNPHPPHRRHPNEPDPQERHRLRRR
jgi:PAS domain S-box-containing protein